VQQLIRMNTTDDEWLPSPPAGLPGETMIGVQCPICRHQFLQTIGRLKDEPRANCPACGRPVDITLGERKKRPKSKQ
jgi:endogenous inhibitor of DNA gyrase (YacG/DUF329 family)